ncbi:MAG: septal ring lytic transglycosylase RlpA family protein [Alphaproteobacteria bacterium]
MRMPKTLGLSLALLVMSSTAMAKQNHSAQNHTAPSFKEKAAPPVKTRNAKKSSAAKRAAAKRKKAVQRSRAAARSTAPLPAADQYIGPLRAAGGSQVGRAAWYGTRHVGRLTASGEPLDTVNATAAHRSLPLHSLVRVTNLENGRSVVVRINDRGPVSRSLLIDMSPRAAAAIDMINDGIVEVMVEPVTSAGGVGASAAR